MEYDLTDLPAAAAAGVDAVDAAVVDAGVDGDNEDGDIGDSDIGDGDIDIAVLDGIERDLADVELALERLGDGTYGRCESCGQPLGEQELEAAPAGRFCRAHLPLDRS